MRIIGGEYKHRRFEVPSSFKARPTTDFAKENIFNVINNLMDLEDAEALDLFSGTGSIAFELLSRGCRSVVAVEKNRQHAAFIDKVTKMLKTDALTLVCGDAFRFIHSVGMESYDFIFADPPYDLPELPDVPEMILTGNLLRPGGLFIMEHPKKYDFSSLPLFIQHREYGAVNFSLFSKP